MEQCTETFPSNWPPDPEAKKIIFFDRRAALDEKDIKVLENFGYTVIGIEGNPHQVLSLVRSY